MSVSIFDVAKPPYEQFFYVSYGVAPGGEVQVYVWPFVSARGPVIFTYPIKDQARALAEVNELATLIATTRRLLDLHVPVTKAQKL